MAISCKVCGHTQLSKPGICMECCANLGIVPLPESTRPRRACRACGATRFVRAVPREYVGDSDGGHALAAPMLLTHRPLRWNDGEIGTDPRRGFGLLEAWVCLACEAVEWYCRGAAQIPIGPEYMTELVDVDPDAPYR